MAALGAKYELTQQIFTKTMAIQVWKPENERPGRHFVYTTLYVEFFVKLLLQTRDWATLEALAKRIRKRAGDFVNHSKLWSFVMSACMEVSPLNLKKLKLSQGNANHRSSSASEAAFFQNKKKQFSDRSPISASSSVLPVSKSGLNLMTLTRPLCSFSETSVNSKN